MKILSLYPWTYISSSALLVNGKIVAASPEERFNRQKLSTAFPILSANWCLDSQKIKWDELNAIVIPWNPAHHMHSASLRWVSSMRWRGEMLSHIPTWLMRAMRLKSNNEAPNSMDLNFGRTKVVFLNHHLCHAASAIYASPFKEADILTIDGRGETETCFLGYAKGKKISQKKSIIYPHSVGLFYGTVTNFLGFLPDSDEWKVMALSSYSKNKNIYDKKFESIINFQREGFELDLSYFQYYLFDAKANFYTNKFIKHFGKPREKNTKFEKRHYEIAGAMQRSFEKMVFHLLKITKRVGGKSNNIVLAGGAAMNCVFNGVLENSNLYKNKFIPPWPDDGGVTIGGAYYYYNQFSKKARKIQHVRSPFFGPEFSPQEIYAKLVKYKLKFFKPKNLSSYVAEEISKKKLICWFQGRMEFGHRALGNRSILADARQEKMKNIVNKSVKYRENFRPFAPAVLEEDAHRIFVMKKNQKIEYMEKTVYVKKNWRKKIPAVTHVDGSARVQTVSKNVNAKFYNLIESYKKITKIPVILNTSFNLNGEPIVCSIEDAIRTFYSCGLDILVLGPYVVKK